MSENLNEKVQLPGRKVTVSPEFNSIYTNFIEVGYGPFDVSLVLSESYIDDDAVFGIKRLAKVTMAPAEAKILVGLLQNIISQYETTWGKIVEPKYQPPKTEE